MAECLDTDGIWCQWPGAEAALDLAAPRPALFLDRDGVIVEDVDFLCRPEDVRLIPGAAETIGLANRRGVLVVIVTNQSGIGRGMYGWAEFAVIEARIAAALAERRARLDMVLACPHHPEARPPYRHLDHPCRKPRPGMLLRAAARLNLVLAHSWIVGDRAADLAAGRAAGLAGGLHVSTGRGRAERVEALRLADDGFAVHLAESIAAAPDLVPLLA